MDKIFSTCLNDSDDMTKFESRSKSSGWRDAFCAPARLTTLCLHISSENKTPDAQTSCNMVPVACLNAYGRGRQV
jgi:hypothetical protein